MELDDKNRQIYCRLLLDRERIHGQVETKKKEETKQRGTNREQESKGFEGIAVLIGPCHTAWRAWQGLAIVVVVGVVLSAAELLDREKDGGWEKTRMQGRSWNM